MSDCKKFNHIAEQILNGECSEQDKILFDNHLKECSNCAKDFEFVLNIQNTLRSLPKLEVPDNFLVSLNEKLDLEDKIKKEAPVIRYKNSFRTWKKYSALTACLLLAVLLKVDVWNVSDVPEHDTVSVQTIEKFEEPENVQENIVAPESVLPVEPTSSEEISLIEEQPSVSQNEKSKVKVSEKKEKQVVKTEKSSTSDSKPEKTVSSETTTNNVNTVYTDYNIDHHPDYLNLSKKETQNTQQKEKVVIIKASTPHSNVDMPEYMDDKESIIVEASVPTKKVDFNDYEMVESDTMLEALSLAEIPSNKVIVASSAAMNTVSNMPVAIQTVASTSIQKSSALGGSLVVSADDEEIVETILNKYSSTEEDNTFMLPSKSYDSFIEELDYEGVEYKDYLISTEKTNVAFELIVS